MDFFILEENKMEPVIRISHLQKNYGSKVVLKDINFDIYPGQII